jgi:hypothetical protein
MSKGTVSMPPHEHFEELCALAVSGQLREDELAELGEHLRSCEECRRLSRAFEETYLILSAAEEAKDTAGLPEGMTQRFIARARLAGIPLELPPSNRSERGMLRRLSLAIKSRSMVSWAPIMMVVLGVASFFLGMRYQTARHPLRPPPVTTSQDGPPNRASQASDENVRLKEQLRDAQAHLATASARLKEEKEERASLIRQIAALNKSTSELRESETNQKTKLGELAADLEKIRAKENAARIASLASEAEVSTLRDRIAKLTMQLGAARELDSTLHEAYDLIVDRNVHVLNVLPEAGENARSSQPRGRIFYAEGKKLVFYAYDLANPTNLNGKPSFYLWGQTPDTVRKVVGLGKFQVDSEQQGRWVLRVTEPRLLANINSVFVTEERYQKDVTQPSGKRMLFRVLDARANDQ